MIFVSSKLFYQHVFFVENKLKEIVKYTTYGMPTNSQEADARNARA